MLHSYESFVPYEVAHLIAPPSVTRTSRIVKHTVHALNVSEEPVPEPHDWTLTSHDESDVATPPFFQHCLSSLPQLTDSYDEGDASQRTQSTPATQAAQSTSWPPDDASPLESVAVSDPRLSDTFQLSSTRSRRFMLYRVTLQYASGQQLQLWRRYSDFLRLRQHLLKEHPSPAKSCSSLPGLPTKWQIGALKDCIVLKRLHAFNVLLQAILKLGWTKSPSWERFIQLQEYDSVTFAPRKANSSLSPTHPPWQTSGPLLKPPYPNYHMQVPSVRASVMAFASRPESTSLFLKRFASI